MKNIFVSSTFRDMQAERDLIQKEVLPQLRSKAKEYGENINMIDLRWGVDTSELESEEGSMKVMSVCLDEVERSRPYMLIFLGDRYGSIIDPAITERVIARKDSSFRLDDYAISITAMEVEFGALSAQVDSLENCVVCMRSFSPESIGDEVERAVYSAEDEERAKKQQAFREKVTKKVQGRVIEYTCDWDEEKKQLVNFKTMDGTALSERLIATYETMFQKEWQTYSELSWEEKEQLAVDALMESKLRTFRGRETLINHYYERVTHESGALILQGEVGSGKTSIMCKLMEKLAQDGKKVFRFVAGNSSMSETTMQLVQQLVYYLESVCDATYYNNAETRLDREFEDWSADKHSEYDGWLERLKHLLALLDQDERIYVVVDALDQMQQDERTKYLTFLLNNPQVRYVLSCTKEFEIPMPTNGLELKTEQIPELNESDVLSVVDGLMTANSKDTYKAIQDAILAKKSNKNPLYISMLIQRLNMMSYDDLYYAKTERDIIFRSFELIDSMPDTTWDAAVFLLDEAVKRFDTEENGLKEVVNLIGVSRNGLREHDLQIIALGLGKVVKQLDISRLLHYLDTFFVIHQDGRIDFTHKVIRQGLQQKIVEEGHYSKYVNEIATRVKALKSDDEFWKREGMFYARMSDDAGLAEEILAYAHQSSDSLVLEAIKAEGLADGGDFYVYNMKKMPKAKLFFEQYQSVFCDTKEELLVQEKLHRNFSKWMEERFGEEECTATFLDMLVGYLHLGMILVKQEKIEEAQENLLKAYSIFKEIKDSKAMNPRLLSGLFLICINLGHAYEKKDMFEKALQLFENALEVSNGICERNTGTQGLHCISLCYHAIGNVWLRQEKAEQALDYFEQALVISQRIYEMEHNLNRLADVAVSYGSVASVYKQMQKADNAISYYLKAAKLWEEIYTAKRSHKDLLKLVETDIAIAELVKGLNQKAQAIVYYRKAAEGLEELCKKDKNLFAMYIKVCGEMLASSDETEKFYYWKKRVEILEEIYEISSDIAFLKKAFRSAELLYSEAKRAGKTDVIVCCQEKCLEILTEMSKREESQAILEQLEKYNSIIGGYYLKKGDVKQALEYYRASLEIQTQMYHLCQNSYELHKLGEKYRRIAKVFMEGGLLTEAIEYCEKGVEISRTFYENKAGFETDIFTAYDDMGEIYIHFGMMEEGLSYYKKALELREKYCAERKGLNESLPNQPKQTIAVYLKNAGPKKAMRELPGNCDKIGQVLESMGRLDEAFVYYEKAQQIRKEHQEGS